MQKQINDVVITNALRTPIGKYRGNLASYQAYDLGSEIIKKLLDKSKILPDEIDEVVMGQVLTGNTG